VSAGLVKLLLGVFPFVFWLPSPSQKSRVYDQTPNLSGSVSIADGREAILC
jgi:hypothetical protein